MYLPPSPVEPKTLRTVLLVSTPGCFWGTGSLGSRALRAKASQSVWNRLFHQTGSPPEEDGNSISPRVWRDLLQDLNSVVCQEVVQFHLPQVTKHTAGRQEVSWQVLGRRKRCSYLSLSSQEQ